MKRNNILIGLSLIFSLINGCENNDFDLPDFDYQTVYFASQYPVRTVVLGDDANVDNTLDKQHKVEIKATLGGTRDNKENVVIDFKVDNSLLDDLYFPNNGPKIEPLPTDYYSLASEQIVITPDNIMGGVQVQLTDAFFADLSSIQNTYAIPLKMNSVQNADSILSTKNFVLYALKFVNPWHGNYLRRGTDVMTGDVSRNVFRRAAYVENDEINKLSTRSLQSTTFPVQFRDADGGNLFSCTLLLDFDEKGKCTISTNTTGYTATGSGSFVKKGEKNSWGNKDRDVLYLDYQINYNNITIESGDTTKRISGEITTKDTLVMRDRAISPEYFSPVMQ